MTYMTCLDSTTNLTYALVTDPEPLQVSLSGTDSSTADIQLVITNQQADAVGIKGVAITVVIGDGPDALSGLTTAALDTQLQPNDVWQITPPQVAAGDDVYTLTQSDSGTGQLPAGDSIVLTFAAVPINEILGTTVLAVAEKTSMGGGATSWALSKFPYGFSFGNLCVRDPQSQAVLSQVGHGGAIQLVWDGSVTSTDSYRVLYSTAAGQQTGTLTTVNQWDLPQVFEDTIFNVEVTVNDSTGQQVTHSLATSVAVAQPDLSVSSVNLAGQDVAGELATMTKSLVPTGTIAMWSGSPTAVPAGWALCDGTNGTPNLVNQFIFGAGSSGPAPGSTGGSASHSHTASANVSVANAGSHTHGVPSPWYSNTASSGGGVTVVDRDKTEAKNAQTQTAGDHTHTATAVVSVDPTTTLPPWYALCFIIKQI